jgi:hypothetical protein
MGGSGGGTFSNKTPEELRSWVREAEGKAVSAAFAGELASTLGDLLAEINNRDGALVNQRLAEVKAALSESLEGNFDQLFGGSVAKHTYVDGLSDIDSLLVINDSDLAGAAPRDVLSKMSEHIAERIGHEATVTHGAMAVTIKYADGMVVQVLPALRTKDGTLRVPSSRTDGWSEIDPLKFQHALTKRNQECNGKLVPTIKLAKAINGQLPESQRLSGYHMESLGIAAFKGYNGEKTPAAMLTHFFDSASKLVLSPIRDRTGQSVHVDDYLGPDMSDSRQTLGHVLGRISRRMQNATAASSTEQWKAIFGVDG